MIFSYCNLLGVFSVVFYFMEVNLTAIHSVDEALETITPGNLSQYDNSSRSSWPMFHQVLQMAQIINAVILALAGNNGSIHDETPYDSKKASSRMVNPEWENCPSCGVLNRNRIVGGRQGSISEYPWTVSIRINGAQHCGGSVINRMYILTAGHCVAGEDVTKFEIIAAVTDVTDQKALKTTVVSGKVHEKFHSSTFDYDIAILELVNPLPLGRGVKPICLVDSDDDLVGEIAIVTGWGALKETDSFATDQLNKVEVPIVGNQECMQASGLKGQVITDRMMCGGYLDGSKDACIGDSGGPLVLKEKGVWKQIGIVSWGIGCARPGFYGIYSRVSSLLSWIATNTPNGKC